MSAMPNQIQSPMESSAGVPEWMIPGDKLAAELFDSEDATKARQVWEMLQKAKRFREHWAKHWDRYWMLWEGEQWRRQRPQSLHQAVVNEVFSTVETFVGHVAQAIPPIRAVARHYRHRESAEMATKIGLYVDEMNEVDVQYAHALRSAAVCGVGWFKCDWDETRNRSRGEVVYRPVDEKFMFVAPHARTLEEASYVIEAMNVPREFVVKTWERGGLVPPGVWDGSLTNIRVTGGVDRLWDLAANFTTTDGSQTQQTFAAQQSSKSQKDLVTLIRAWIRQDDGTLRLVEVSNGIVLQDGPSPYDDEEYPYVPVHLIPTLDGIYGRSIIQFVERLQDELNQMHSYALDQQEFASNNPLVVDIANVEEGDLLTNEPGAIFINKSVNGPGFYPLTMGGTNPKWMEMQEQVRNLMDDVLGRVDVLKGEKPAGVNTLGGLEIIREEANVRLAKMSSHVKASKRALTRLVLSRVRQFLHDERVLRVTGKGGSQEYVEVNKRVGYDATGEPMRANVIPEDAEYDIDFAHASPGGRQAEIELALALAKTPAQDGMPMVDRQFVLEKALEDSVEVDEVMKRMQALAEEQAKAAAEAEAAKNPQAQEPGEDPESEALSVMMGNL